MPIISKIGRRALTVKALFLGIYLVLIGGGITMLYPFLLMVATSLTDEVDYREYRIIPRYFTQADVRYAKVMAEKYQELSTFLDCHVQQYGAWDQVGMPTYVGDTTDLSAERKDRVTGNPLPARTKFDVDYATLIQRVDLWRQFKQKLQPYDFGVWFVGKSATPGKAELMWRDYLRPIYKDDKEAMVRDMGVTSGETYAPYERCEGRLWSGVPGKKGQYWDAFKEGLDPRFRRPVDGTILWQAYVKYKYDANLDKLNAAYGTKFTDFQEVALPAIVPSNKAMAADWEYAVRNEMPYRFVAIKDGDAQYRKFLVETCKPRDDKESPLAAINRQLATQYASMEEIVWPPKTATLKELGAVSPFLWTAGPVEDLRVATPDKQYAAFLKEKLGDLDKVNQQLALSCKTFDDIRPPIDEEDLWEYNQDQGSWMKWFLTNNYREVVDYIAVHGRSLWNTLILVSTMVLCALTVNPLAAYALSRFKLGYANQILLFLLATMAFPGEISMIPNFLLLRRFPLWIMIVGGVVGVTVALIILSRARGAKMILALPCGVGAAAIAGMLTPYVGTALGFSEEQVGSVSLLNTFGALILPGIADGYGIFLLKGFFDSLPEELFEAGRIDGAGELRMLWQVAIPLSTPILAVIALSTFTEVYGSYLWALVVCQNEKMWTLMVYIFQLQQWAPSYTTMAATMLASIPTLLVFVLAQNTIMRGIIIPVEK